MTGSLITMPTTYPHDRMFVAAVTPFAADGSIDEPQFRRLLRYFLDTAAHVDDFGIIVNPEAGEVFYLAPDEQARVVEIAVDEVRGAVPLFTGFLANSTADAGAVAVRLAGIGGVNGLFIMPPIGALDVTMAWDPVAYPEVWADMIGAVTRALPDTPLICHPVAAPTAGYGVGLPLEPTIELLQRFPQIVGWKMTYNYEGFRKVARGIRTLDRHVGILAATAVNFHENLANGTFDGTVTGSFNYALEPMLDHIAAWRSGDHARALEIWNGGLAQLHEYVYEQWGRLHVRYKTAAWLHGVIDTPYMRPPMPLPRKAEIAHITNLIAQTGMKLIDDASIAAVTDRLPR